ASFVDDRKLVQDGKDPHYLEPIQLAFGDYFTLPELDFARAKEVGKALKQRVTEIHEMRIALWRLMARATLMESELNYAVNNPTRVGFVHAGPGKPPPAVGVLPTGAGGALAEKDVRKWLAAIQTDTAKYGDIIVAFRNRVDANSALDPWDLDGITVDTLKRAE